MAMLRENPVLANVVLNLVGQVQFCDHLLSRISTVVHAYTKVYCLRSPHRDGSVWIRAGISRCEKQVVRVLNRLGSVTEDSLHSFLT